ncbi:MAG: hypothetical protein K2X98_05220 [Alphaproteobacteria bacterium]|nr:hypothetical protein [Alphaproteobacteria bacterium]
MKKTLFILAATFATILALSNKTFAAQQEYGIDNQSSAIHKMWHGTAPESEYRAITDYWSSWIPKTENAVTPQEKFSWMKTTFFQNDITLAQFYTDYFPLQGIDPTYRGGSFKTVTQTDAPHFFKNLSQIITHIHTAYTFIPDWNKQETDSQRRDYLIHLTTMPKTIERQTNQIRLDLLKEITSNALYTPAQQAFAKYIIVEQKVKHGLIDPTCPPVDYTWSTAIAEYTAILDSQQASLMTEMSVRYHLGELYLEQIDGGTQDFEKAQTFFSEVKQSNSAHPLTHFFIVIKLQKMITQ